MRKMGLRLVALVLLLAGPNLVYAGEPGLTISPRVWSQYLGSTGAVVKTPVLQTDFFIQLPRGFYGDVWHSVGLDGSGPSSGFDDEVDYTLGWSGPIGALTFDLGAAYFDLVNLGTIRGDVIQPYFETRYDFRLTEAHTLSPYLRLELAYPVKGDTPNAGVHLFGGAQHNWKIAPAFAVAQRAALLYDDGAYGLDNGLLVQYGGDLQWTPTAALTLNLFSLKISVPLTVDDARKSEAVFGVGLTFRY